jgi:hypothetical protein
MPCAFSSRTRCGMSTASQDSFVDRIEHEIRCLKAIDVGLQGLPPVNVGESERDFAHLIQDRIDSLVEIMDDLEARDREAGHGCEPVSPAKLPRPAGSRSDELATLDALDREIRVARGIEAALEGMFLAANRDPRLGGVLALQDQHLSGLVDLKNRLDAARGASPQGGER